MWNESAIVEERADDEENAKQAERIVERESTDDIE
jgi:hypothetical protein